MQLHPFQRAGAIFLAGRSCAYIADEMGLGKTPQIVEGIRLAGARRALIIAPAILERAWAKAFATWAPERGEPYSLRDPKEIPPRGDVIASYDRAVMHRDALRDIRFDVLACDEAHNLKNYNAARTKAVLNPMFDGRRAIASGCGAVWHASGTPVPNNASELWPVLRQARLTDARFWEFAGRFCNVTLSDFGRRLHGVRNIDVLRALLSGYMIRRTVPEVLPELPELHVDTCVLDGAEIDRSNPILPKLREMDADAYDAISACIESGDWRMRHVPHIAAIRRLTGLAKAPAAVALAKMDLDFLHEKIVLFGVHSDVLAYLAFELRKFGVVLLTGSETQAKRAKSIEKFQSDPGCRVAVCQMRAAGAGLTLHAADRLLVVESAWTAADNDQAVKRIHRIGQFKQCFASFLALRGSSDERVTQAVRAKAKTSASIFDKRLDGLDIFAPQNVKRFT